MGLLERLGKGYCPCCDTKARFKAVNDIPGRECPRCGSRERHRQLALLFRARPAMWRPGLRVLHMAPEAAIRRLVESHRPGEYVTGDLQAAEVDVQFDLTSAPFDDDAFDVILCNHVLEHIPDDRAALRELRRMLAPGGWAIVMSPLLREVTDEEPYIDDPAEQLRRFGQEDHVRRYGWDYVDRQRDAGFTPEVVRLEEMMSKAEVARYRLRNPEGQVEPIFLVT